MASGTIFNRLTGLIGAERAPVLGGAAKQLVVILHGVRGDCLAAIALADHWASELPNAAFLAPQAPFPCDVAPYGFQWFSVRDHDKARRLAEAEVVAPILDVFLDEALTTYGLTNRHLALIGFSQGAMMALHIGLRRRQAVAAIIGFSGRLLKPDMPTTTKAPVLLIHGDQDIVVPIEALTEAASALRASGVSVETEICLGLDHDINPFGLARAQQFLKTHLLL
jgi:phospholipase/carboxylesterase